MAENELFITVPELARVWRCRSEFIRKLIEDHDLPHVNTASPGSTRKRIKIDRKDLDLFKLATQTARKPKQRPIRRRRKRPEVIEFY